MNERQAKIIAAVVEEYTRTAEPVGSHIIAKKYVSDVSPATIRNDMSFLEDEGYLYQPHVSSGRIPTDKGYRLFIESFMRGRELSREDQAEIQKEILQLRAKNARMAKTMAKLLSALSGNMAVGGMVEKDEYYEFGMRHLIEDREHDDLDEMCRLVEVLDSIDEHVRSLLDKVAEGETRIFVGAENPIRQMRGYSMVISRFRADDDSGFIGIIGPKRMSYARNKSLLECVQKWANQKKDTAIFVLVGSTVTLYF